MLLYRTYDTTSDSSLNHGTFWMCNREGNHKWRTSVCCQLLSIVNWIPVRIHTNAVCDGAIIQFVRQSIGSQIGSEQTLFVFLHCNDYPISLKQKKMQRSGVHASIIIYENIICVLRLLFNWFGHIIQSSSGNSSNGSSSGRIPFDCYRWYSHSPVNFL